jgi:hypothetical protein
MFKDIIVIDNIFDDPDSEVEYIMQQEFLPNTSLPGKGPAWKGLRTNSLHTFNTDKHHEYFKHILEKIIHHDKAMSNDFTWSYQYKGSIVFHKLMECNKFERSWIHTDTHNIYAGVIYLTKNPPLFSGTLIEKRHETVFVENKYNRLVFYRSDYLHSALSGFGDESCPRLTISFFLNEFTMTVLSNKGSN